MSETSAPKASLRESLKLSEYRKLSIDDRIRLVQEIWDSIAEETVGSTELPEWQKRELDAALEEHRQSPDDVSDWRKAMGRIRASIDGE